MDEDPTSALTSVDLPTLGAPIRATKPQRVPAPASIIAAAGDTFALDHDGRRDLFGRTLAAAHAFGYPLVLKAIGGGALLHKSDVGGVVLDIAGEAMLVAAFERLAGLVERHAGEGVLVQPMVRGLEAFVGARRDPTFGPVVVVGLGGIYVEVLREVTLRLAPLGREEARAAILGARWSPLLRGARGRKPHDVNALADVLHRVSRLAAELELESLDLNPVMVGDEGRGVAIADFRLMK